MDINDLRHKRGAAVKQARDLMAAAEAEKRDLTAEEQTRVDALFAEDDKLKDQIEREERAQAKARELEESRDPANRPTPGGGGTRDQAKIMAEFRTWVRSGQYGPEFRALQADIDTSGGFLVTPQQFSAELIKAVDDQVFIRELSNVIQVERAESLGAASLDADPADADWTSEIQTGSEDSTMAMGKRELHPHPLAKRIKVSNKLLRLVPAAEGLVRDRLAYKFGISFEKSCLTGNGVGKPLGVFTASSQGISTGRDVVAGSATDITGDGIYDVFYSLKAAYWQRATWLVSREFVKRARKLKTTDNQYLWQPGLQAGQPDLLAGAPFKVSEYVPTTYTTGQYVSILGDFKAGYWIADGLSVSIQRLNELYAETNQVGFIGRLESDGMPVLEEAFVRAKLA